jgi:hypothetical protein
MANKITFFFIVLLPFAAISQNNVVRKGNLRAMATISPGWMLKQKATNINLHGNIEYYFSEKASFGGDIYYFLGTQELNNNSFTLNHSLFFGGFYHFKKKSWDPFIGFQPGIALVQGKEALLPSGEVYVPAKTINPLASLIIGSNFYAGKFFHFFISLRYLKGTYLSNAPSPLSLDELRLSAGLGFNVNLIRKEP